jgi:hypothetical protein
VGALLSQVLFTTVSQAQKNLILNPGFEKLNLIRFRPTFIDGQFYDGLRYDTSFLWGLGWENSRVCSQFVNWQVADTCLTDNTRYSAKRARSGNVYAYIYSDIIRITGLARFKDLGLSFTEPLVAGAEYAFCCFADIQDSTILNLNEVICLNVLDSAINLDFEYDLKPHLTKVTRKPKNLAFTIDKDKTCHSFDVAAQKGYQKICLRFIAKGGEKHLVIGNLKRVVQCRYKKNLEEDRYATKILFKSDIGLVHIDDCSLIRINHDDKTEMDSAVAVSFMDGDLIVTREQMDSSQSHLLTSIYFDHGLSVVHDMDGLRRALDSINQLEHKNCRLMVLGYTDGTGNAAQNAALSLDRARTVSQMILDIYPTVQLSYTGEGSLDVTPLVNPKHRRADVYLIDCK